MLSLTHQRGSPEGDSGGQETEDERRERQERRAVGDTSTLDKKSPGDNLLPQQWLLYALCIIFQIDDQIRLNKLF